MKQETLEEAKKYVESFEYPIAHPKRVAIKAFINGAKWQKENRDIFTIEFALWIAKNNYHREHYYKYEHFEELLNEFKK